MEIKGGESQCRLKKNRKACSLYAKLFSEEGSLSRKGNT